MAIPILESLDVTVFSVTPTVRLGTRHRLISKAFKDILHNVIVTLKYIKSRF